MVLEMENQAIHVNIVREEDEEDFCSCCEYEEGWKETKELVKEESKEDLDEFSVKMFFKGISISDIKDSSSWISGIGVVWFYFCGCGLIFLGSCGLILVDVAMEELAMGSGSGVGCMKWRWRWRDILFYCSRYIILF